MGKPILEVVSTFSCEERQLEAPITPNIERYVLEKQRAGKSLVVWEHFGHGLFRFILEERVDNIDAEERELTGNAGEERPFGYDVAPWELPITEASPRKRVGLDHVLILPRLVDEYLTTYAIGDRVDLVDLATMQTCLKTEVLSMKLVRLRDVMLVDLRRVFPYSKTTLSVGTLKNFMEAQYETKVTMNTTITLLGLRVFDEKPELLSRGRQMMDKLRSLVRGNV